MTDPNHQPPTTSARRRRWIAFGIVVLFFGLLVFAYLRDVPLEDFSDLEPQPPLSPAADEVLADWRTAFSKRDEAAYEAEQTTDRELLRRVNGEIPWRQEPVSNILAANADLIEGAKRVDALGAFRFPADRKMKDAIPYLSELQYTAKILKMHTVDRWRAGDHDAALESALIGFRLGDRATAGSFMLVDLLVAITCQAINASAVEQIISSGFSEAQLGTLATELAVAEPDYAALMQNLMRAEFQLLSGAILTLERTTENFDAGPMRIALQFKPNRTVNALAEMYRENIPPHAAPAWSRTFPPPPEPATKLQELSSNAVGRMILLQGATMSEVILLKCELQLAYRRALRVKIALLRHQLEHGSLPKDLAALVPTYLDSVPLDPFDGSPLRYDPARGAVWSVGKDLTDDGGTTAPEPGRHFSDKKLADPILWVSPMPVGPEPEAAPSPRRRRRSRP